MKTLLLGFSCGTGRPMTWCSAQNAGAHEEACRGRATPQAAWSAGVGVDWTRSTREPLAADRWEGPTGSCDRESRGRLSVQLDQGLRHGDRAWPLGSHSGPAKSPPRPPSGEFVPFWVQRGAVGRQHAAQGLSRLSSGLLGVQGLQASSGIRPLSHSPVRSHHRAAPGAGSLAGFQEGDEGSRGGPVGPSPKPVSGRWGPTEAAGGRGAVHPLCREAGASWVNLCQDAGSWGHRAPGR